MDYRDIIKSRDLRMHILKFFGWVPDTVMVRIQYWMKTGRRLNLKSPKRYTEKLQLYKIKYRNPLMLRCTDKYEVRRYVQERGMGEYLVPLVGVYKSVDDICFGSLPDMFVAKTTDGAGGNQVLVCRDKSSLGVDIFKKQLTSWLQEKRPGRQAGREWAYENGFPRRIIIEQLVGNGQSDLIDYKFFCFNGTVSYIYGISDRKLGVSAKLGIYDSDFNKLDVSRCDEEPQLVPLDKPEGFETMKRVAERLSYGFPHVRVDLYNVNGKIYFGELTFYDGSGYMTFSPDSFDEEMGSRFDL